MTWTYQVTNSGNTPLEDIRLIDDRLGAVSCPVTSLAIGASTTCIRTGSAQAGQYSNTATVTATSAGTTVTDQDPSHYFGGQASIDIEKATNGNDADSAPGPTIEIGSAVQWTYTIRNTGNLILSDVSVTDDQGVTVTCPPEASELTPNEVQVCTASGTASNGQYANLGSVSGTPPVGSPSDRPRPEPLQRRCQRYRD